MAVLFATGFEHGAVTYARRMGVYFSSVAAASLVTTAGFVHQMGGRGGLYSLLLTSGTFYSPIVPTSARWLHFWFRTADTTPPIGSSWSVTFTDSARNNQWSVVFRTDGFIELRRGSVASTLVATSGAAVNYANGHWIEIELLAANAGGTSTVYVDGASFVTFSGDTQATTVPDWAQAQIHNSGEDIYYDDVIVTDATTGQLGEQTGVGFRPNSDVSAGWTPSTGSNFQNVNAVPAADSPTSNNSATVTATEDIYGLSYPQGATSIAFVAAFAQSRRQGALNLQTGIRSGATTGYSAAAPPGAGGGDDALIVHSHILTQNPDTVAPWDPADLPNLQAAVKTS